MPSINFNLNDIKPLLSAAGVGQAPPAPLNSNPVQPPAQLPPVPAAAGFSDWIASAPNAKAVSDGIVLPGTPLIPPTPSLGAGIPIDPNASKSLMPPQSAPMAFLNPPKPSYQGPLANAVPQNPFSLFGGDDKTGTVSQRVFQNPVTQASGLHDKMTAAKDASPRPSAPLPFIVPPTLNPNPLNPPTPSAPQLPQAASAPSAGITQPPTGTQPAPNQVSGPSQLLPYYDKLKTDQAELQRQQTTGSGVSQIKNPWLRTIARIGDVAGSLVAPGVATAIPGTTYHHDLTMAQQGQRIAGDRQDIQDVTGAQQAAANLAHINAETADIGNRSQLQLARYGLKTETDPTTGITSTVPDTESPVYKANQDKDAKLQQQTELIGAQIDNTKAQKELRDATAAFTSAKSNPNSPLFQQTQTRLKIAQQNAAAAQTRATAYMGNYLKGAYNVGNDGQTLPGAPIIANDNGQQTVVGATNSGSATKANANAAQFNDVHGALDSLEGAADALVNKGGRLNSPGIAAALSQPAGTLGQWLQGEGVKANLTPEERNYVTAVAAAHENVQALRKSAGGTATDSAVSKLDALIPGVSTPDIDYLKRQTSQIRSTAERLGKGATTASGGLTVRGQQKGGITPPPTGGASIKVQLKDGTMGTIHSSQKARFLKDNPGSKVVTDGK